MLKIVLALLLLVGSSLGVFTVTPLAGGSVSGTLPKPATASNYYDLAYYQVAVPINTRDIAFSFENLDTAACDDLAIYMSYSLPCSKRDSATTLFPICRSSYEEEFSTSTDLTFGPEGVSDLNWRVNTTLFIGIGRTLNTDNTTCQFRINTTLTPCPNAEGGITQTGYFVPVPGVTICYPFRPVIANLVIPAANIPSNSSFFGVVTVPPGAVSIRGVVNATTEGLTLSGQNYGLPNLGVDNDICTTSDAVPGLNGTFTYTLQCDLPASGPFFFGLSHEAGEFSLYNATLLLTFQTCPTGMGGFNCSAMSTPFTESAAGTSFSLPVDGWRYFYYDFTGTQEASWTITATTNNTGTLWVRKGGYPYNEGYVTPVYEKGFSNNLNYTFYITEEDTFNGGVYYVGIQNDGDAASQYTLYGDVQQYVAPTEADTTQEEPNPTEPSAATGLFPYTVVAALLAIFSSFF